MGMALKIDIRKIIFEMGKNLKSDRTRKSVYVSEEVWEKFGEACTPMDRSPVLEYLMECVIRGSGKAKGKK